MLWFECPATWADNTSSDQRYITDWMSYGRPDRTRFYWMFVERTPYTGTGVGWYGQANGNGGR